MPNVVIQRKQMRNIVAMCGLHTRVSEGMNGRKRGKIAQDCSVTEEDRILRGREITIISGSEKNSQWMTRQSLQGHRFL